MRKVTFPKQAGRNFFLPENYPRSVQGSYRRFVGWNFLQMTFSSALGVLSTQQLLLALGIGSVSSSAALNWVMKDGLGQLGGVLFAGTIGSRFDGSVKHYRWISSLVLNLACGLEMAANCFPAHFLLIASLSTTGKNISYLSASATKAAINLSFCNAHNLADVTAKNGTQTTAACLIGTALGTAMAYSCQTYTQSLIAFGLCSIVNLYGTWGELTCVTLRHINVERGVMLFLRYFETGNFISPAEVNVNEPFLIRQKVKGLRICEAPADLSSPSPLSQPPSFLIFPVSDQVHLLYSLTCSDEKMIEGFALALSLLYSKQIHYKLEMESMLVRLRAAGWETNKAFLEPYQKRYSLD